eukprot:5469217-Prymnesium_polylepis.1
MVRAPASSRRRSGSINLSRSDCCTSFCTTWKSCGTTVVPGSALARSRARLRARARAAAIFANVPVATVA